MTFDLIVLAVLGLFALWGALSGAAKQLGQAIAVAVAYLAARPVGSLLGPTAATQLKVSLQAGLIISTLFSFFIVFLFVRWGASALVLRLLAGKELGHRSVDRLLGAALGAAKIGGIVYLVLCAIAFVENNVSIAGYRLNLAPKDSVAVQLTRRFNVFELTHLGGAKDLLAIARQATDPAKAAALKKSPAYVALKKDPRIAQALESEALRRAVQHADARALLEDPSIVKLLQDPEAMKRLSEASAALDGR